MDKIRRRERFGSHLGLDRIRLVCSGLGNPQNSTKFVHIAGTNGKGSVAAFIANALQHAGYRVGLFTSPHLVSFGERIRINGVMIEDRVVEELSETVDEVISRVEKDHPDLGAVTEFEMTTAIAFLYFARQDVDIVVLETGLGGRLDATNVVTPEVSVITPIGHDHMDRLGTTLKEIAWEKAGIIKQQIPVVLAKQLPEAKIALQQVALESQAPLYSLDEVAWHPLNWGLRGGSFSFSEVSEVPFDISLLGEHQIENAATALLTLKVLNNRGWHISERAMRNGLMETRWPGRMEVVSLNPTIILDGGHNQEGLDALVSGLRHLAKELGERKFTFVFGMLGNKRLELVDSLFPLASRFVFTKAESGRLAPQEPHHLVDYAQSKGLIAVGYDSVRDALQDAITTPPICVCGSLYLLGTVKRELLAMGIVNRED